MYCSNERKSIRPAIQATFELKFYPFSVPVIDPCNPVLFPARLHILGGRGVLPTTMSDTITLLCLVYGVSSQYAFPVDITKNKLVRHLEKQIHKECQSQQLNSYSGMCLSPSMMMPYSKASCSKEDQDNGIQKLHPLFISIVNFFVSIKLKESGRSRKNSSGKFNGFSTMVDTGSVIGYTVDRFLIRYTTLEGSSISPKNLRPDTVF